MKKRLLLIIASFLLLGFFTSCSEYKSTSLTVVNASEHEILTIELKNGFSGRRPINNVLVEGETLSPGEKITLGLVPVLFESSSADLRIEVEMPPESELISEESYAMTNIEYIEGAEVIITFNDENPEELTILGGTGEMETDW